jgi:hypothetical protein
MRVKRELHTMAIYTTGINVYYATPLLAYATSPSFTPGTLQRNMLAQNALASCICISLSRFLPARDNARPSWR